MRRQFARFIALALVAATLSIAAQTTQSAAAAQATFNTDNARFESINAIYEDFLGRRATGDEINRFGPRFGIGQSENDVRARVLASRAFFLDAGASRDSFVRALYRQVEGRAPTTGELERGKRLLYRTKGPLVGRRLILSERVLERASYDPDGFGITELVLHKNAAGDITRFAFEVDQAFTADNATVTVSIKGQRVQGIVRVRAFENIVSLLPFQPVPVDGKIVGLVFADLGDGGIEIADISTPSRRLPPRVEKHSDKWPDRVFEDQRIVAYYGNHLSPLLGVLGETGPEAAVARVNAAAARFDEPGKKGTGAFEMIVTVAQASAGGDGNYSHPSKIEDVARWIDVAEREGLYVILDIQPGRSDFYTESIRYRELLLRPNVGLALDPEWRMGPTQRPGQTVGSVTAAEVNRVSKWLSDLVVEKNLPEKMFIVHQFQSRMIKNRQDLVNRPGLATIIHADGFGGRAIKLQTYSIIKVGPPFYNGFKLFIDEDTRMFQPREVLAFDTVPVPDLITYQ